VPRYRDRSKHHYNYRHLPRGDRQIHWSNGDFHLASIWQLPHVRIQERNLRRLRPIQRNQRSDGEPPEWQRQLTRQPLRIANNFLIKTSLGMGNLPPVPGATHWRLGPSVASATVIARSRRRGSNLCLQKSLLRSARNDRSYSLSKYPLASHHAVQQDHQDEQCHEDIGVIPLAGKSKNREHHSRHWRSEQEHDTQLDDAAAT